jgi:hypothetical protein
VEKAGLPYRSSSYPNAFPGKIKVNPAVTLFFQKAITTPALWLS